MLESESLQWMTRATIKKGSSDTPIKIHIMAAPCTGKTTFARQNKYYKWIKIVDFAEYIRRNGGEKNLEGKIPLILWLVDCDRSRELIRQIESLDSHIERFDLVYSLSKPLKFEIRGIMK